MTNYKFKEGPNFEKSLHDSIVKELKSKVEVNYCIEHNRFAQLAVVDSQTFSWRVEGCCKALIDKAVKSLQ